MMCPRVATLRPPAFQRPVLGYCVHILSLFLHLLEGPAPQPPCHSRSRPDPQIKAGPHGAGLLSEQGHKAPPRCSCQDRQSSARPTLQGQRLQVNNSPTELHRPWLQPGHSGSWQRWYQRPAAKGCPGTAALPLSCPWGGPAACQQG